MSNRLACCFLLFLGFTWAGCANISTPTGGKRDKYPPKLQAVSPMDSLKNTRVKRIELDFDEYVTVGDVQKEVSIMPILPVDPVVTALNKHVVVKIVDSLLEDNTTYRISFGGAIKDLHEGNPFRNYTYTFSTGSYFDTLRLAGSVVNAATGFPDTASIVVLYNAGENDSAIVKKKPKYKTGVNNKGEFLFTGLPQHSYRIYAIKDANTNLMYDGAAEQVAFNDQPVIPQNDSTAMPVKLRMFAEVPDTGAKKEKPDMQTKGKSKRTGTEAEIADTNFSYTVKLDTSNTAKRTFDINKPVKLVFSRSPLIDDRKIQLSYDSAGMRIIQPYTIGTDTSRPNEVLLKVDWRENKVYRLALDSAFAKDTAGRTVPAAHFAFRTNSEEDYGKIRVNLPSKYYSPGPDYQYLLLVKGDDDTVYQKPVFDTVVNLTRLKPANYTFRIIADKNHNGKWDTGDLLGGRQPEEVIPSTAAVKVRALWEYTADFEDKVKPKPTFK